MQRIRYYIAELFRYIGLKILIYDLGICAVVGGTFLFTHGLSAETFSDRVVWVGIFAVVIGGIVLMGASTAGMQFGVPVLIKKPEEAKKFIAHRDEIRTITELRQNTAIQIFLIGLSCIGIGALVQVFLSKA